MAEPFPTCYLNGEYLPLAEARISPLDRGFLYGDGVYEVMPVYGGRPFRLQAHCARLTRSLTEIRMADPLGRAQWCDIFATLIARNGGGDQYIYWQVTPRRAARAQPRAAAGYPPDGVRLLRAAAGRRARDVGTRSRLHHRAGHPLGALRHQIGGAARQRAVAAARGGCPGRGDHPAARWRADGGLGLDGARGHRRGAAHATQLAAGSSPERRAGSSRSSPRASACHTGRRPSARPSCARADEIWISAATREVQPVTTLDGEPVGAGRPGPLWRRVYDEFQRWKQELQAQPWR